MGKRQGVVRSDWSYDSEQQVLLEATKRSVEFPNPTRGQIAKVRADRKERKLQRRFGITKRRPQVDKIVKALSLDEILSDGFA